MTWTTFDLARVALASGFYNGLGFVLTERDPFAFLDLDIKGEISPEDLARQIQIQTAFDSYSERSPSGKGLHIIIKGHVPRGRKRSHIEIYSSERYMTVTGDVFDNKPIQERQSQLHILWSEMSVGTSIYSDKADSPQTAEDDEILRRAANAANSAKFIALMNGEWGGEQGYKSQSEADFALIDIIAFYTQNRAQILRLFLLSNLGKRDKAQRADYVHTMINRSFDRMLPPISFERLSTQYAALVQTGFNGWSSANTLMKENGATNGVAPFVPVATADVAREGASTTISPVPQGKLNVKFPPGLMGEIATFVYHASQRPVAEVSLAASIGLMAGICGRAYNTPTGAGLNLYTLLIASSGIGKEAMASGISRLVESIAVIQPGTEKVPSIREFIGASEFRSDAALIKGVMRQPSMVSIIGEFGLKLKEMHAPHAAAHKAGIKSVMLDLYGKSGFGNVYRPIEYSDRSKNTESISAPAFSILAESTPSTFYDALDESMIAHGLLPRFLTLEYLGERVSSNESHATVVPTQQLQAALGTLAQQCHIFMHNGTIVPVLFVEESYILAKAFDKQCDREINATGNETIRDLWNRGHLKALKLASLVSVGIDNFRPLISVEAWQWAQQLIEHDINRMVKKFERGDIGVSHTIGEDKQQHDIMRTMRKWLDSPWSDLEKMRAGSYAMHNARVIPLAYIQRRLTSMASFRADRLGAANAINRTLKTLMESGVITEVTGKAKFDVGGRSFMIADFRYLQDEKETEQ
jgi:hypothetical protein